MAKKTKTLTKKSTGSEWFHFLFPAVFIAVLCSVAENAGWLAKGATFFGILIGCLWSYVERLRILNNLKTKP